jgi:hypothetical protein
MKPNVFTFLANVAALVIAGIILLGAPDSTLTFSAWVYIGLCAADILHRLTTEQ